MNKLPYKLRIFEWATKQGKPFTVEEAMAALKHEYGSEAQFTLKRTDEYIQSMLGACMLDAADLDLTEDGDLKITYKVTDFGMGRVKHIPKH